MSNRRCERVNRRSSLRAGGGFVAVALSDAAVRGATAQAPESYGPVDGQLVHPTPNMNGIVVRTEIPRTDMDHTLRATFHNPYAALDTPTFDRTFAPPDSYRQWSYGFDFRVDPVGSRDLAWNAVTYARATDPNVRQQVNQIRRGNLLNLNLGEVETNGICFTACGGTGQFALNSETIAALNLSRLLQPGAVAIGSGYANDDGFGLVPGAITAYQQFQITPAPTPYTAQALLYRYGPAKGGGFGRKYRD